VSDDALDPRRHGADRADARRLRAVAGPRSRVAHVFYDRGGFIGHDGLERFARDFFRVAPFVVLAAYIALYALRRAGVALFWAPTGLGVIFVIATLRSAPG